MTVSSCKIISGRDAKISQNKRSYGLTFQIKADLGDWQPEVILQSHVTGPDKLPRINDVWTYGVTDTLAICTSIDSTLR